MDEAKSILLSAADITGWDDEDMLDIVCDYINEHVGTYGLKEYVRSAVEDELEDEFELELEDEEEYEEEEE